MDSTEKRDPEPTVMTNRQAAVMWACMQLARPTVDAMTSAKEAFDREQYFASYCRACELTLREFPAILERMTGADVARKLIESAGGVL